MTQDLPYALTVALQPTRQAWQQAAGAALAGTGLSVTLATPVLLVSRMGDGISQQALAEKIGVHPAALVRTLDQAEQAQLLERRVAPGNRRQRAIYLLPEGQRVAAEMERSLRALRTELLGDVPPEDLETAVRVLQTLEERARRLAEGE
ncbi:MarR family transcriptional regulator [Dyella solisilvae]|uniref:MarR family transcriptional regulator n=1 Tax=Dyella solisilvae TaxID=1920168 RepID=A0A370K588_9GAMM|nr:MarR family transcriptional regulator [Dyella solisilvae]RDI97803.1 MarR family transcriptional regulator [Dyella solisilvae]